MTEPTFDADGYPTEETLKVIREWPFREEPDFRGLLAYVRKAWKYADGDGWHGWDEEDATDHLDKPCRRYSISTGGWSGNEDLIAALRKHPIFWILCWQRSERGGHFVFEVR